MASKMNDTVCAQCGALITNESPTGDIAQRKPCSQCGSTSRTFSVSIEAKVSVSGSVQAVVITYPQTLLSAARSLIDSGQFSIAVVVLHMACEIATERTLSEAFVKRGIQYLEESVEDLLNGYNLSNDRLRKLYTALTGDTVEKQPFWLKFKDSARRRNGIVHEGKTVGKAEAEESFKAVSDLIAYLKK